MHLIQIINGNFNIYIILLEISTAHNNDVCVKQYKTATANNGTES